MKTVHADAFNRYKTETGAVFDPTTGLLTITQCANLQSLCFVIGGQPFEITANTQIWPRSLNSLIGGSTSPNGIYLVVNDIGTPTGAGLHFVNGYTFLERFYIVYDTTARTIGIARRSSRQRLPIEDEVLVNGIITLDLQFSEEQWWRGA